MSDYNAINQAQSTVQTKFNPKIETYVNEKNPFKEK